MILAKATGVNSYPGEKERQSQDPCYVHEHQNGPSER